MLSHSTIGKKKLKCLRRHQKQLIPRKFMGGKKRQFTPRIRPKRSLFENRTPNSPPQTRLNPPKQFEHRWELDLPLAQRLYQKSGIGMLEQKKYSINHVELIFCFWYRHVPLPESFDFGSLLEINPKLSHEVVLYDELRNGGNILIPVGNLHEREFELPHGSWGAFWDRSLKWQSQNPNGCVKWVHSSDVIDWEEIVEWAKSCISLRLEPILVVIDGEMDVTSYIIQDIEPTGQHLSPESLSEKEVEFIKTNIELAKNTEQGWYVPQHIEAWPLPSFGVEHLSGRFFTCEELDFLRYGQQASQSKKQNLYADLIHRGIMLRPGFKFGCCWRGYSMPMEDEHAPYLIPDIDLLPHNYEALCLALRLSEGVNKEWILPYENKNEGWNYMTLSRWNSS